MRTVNRRTYFGPVADTANATSFVGIPAVPSVAPITRKGPGARFCSTDAAGAGTITEVTVVRNAAGVIGTVITGTLPG